MREDLFTIGKITIHSYGLCIAVGIIVAYLVAEFRVKRKGMSVDTCFNMAAIAAICGMLGAKLMYYIVEIKSIIENPRLLLDFANGFVVYGGIIGGSIACFIYAKVKKLDVLKWFDVIIPEIAIAQGFGRIGCLMAGCCYGRETTSACHIVFTHSHFAPNNVWLYPTQIMSAAGNFINFLLLVFVIDRLFKNRRGIVTSFFLIFYSVGRFVIEIFRGDLERGFVGSLSTSQFVSIFIFAAGIVLFVICMRLPKVSEEPVAEVSGETEASDRDTDDSKTEE
ncbi:MAG: prolipoprotein diacylglyceryl transferase [Lachnospiraceae bacterium]|nr:prolipoprotein diacylglyceryl transferase [Lachnospiraceae bacterium]